MSENHILSPVDRVAFASKYWESQPLHIGRSDAGYFESLLSEEDIFNLVNSGDAIFPEVQAINAKQAIPVASYTTENKSIDAKNMMRFYKDGSTLVVSEVHKKFLPVQELCRQFSSDFSMQCQANAYLSPAGNQGFQSHYDTHDVFVLQIAGRKKFRFYDSGIALPFTEDTYTPGNNSASEMADQVALSAGDTLYIPRGIVHDAIADEGAPSLHITLGAFPFVMRDLLQEMVQVASEREVNLRASVDLSVAEQLPASLHEHLNELLSESIYFEALSRLADEVALSLPTGEVCVPELSLQSCVTVRQSQVHGVERRAEKVKLRLPGRVMAFEEPLSSAVELLLSAGTLKIADIPVLDNEQKLALCQQLAGSGVFEESSP